jgi:ADP-heptose:LPS heptosyltransferase
MDGATIAVLATSTLTFVSMLAKMFYDIFTRAQDRRWAQEDAEKLATKVEDHGKQVLTAIAENTAISSSAAEKADAAYSEANDVNRKIAALGEQIKPI